MGKFTIKNLPIRPKGEVKFSFELNIDKNGILDCNANVVGEEDKAGKVRIDTNQARFSDTQKAAMSKEAKMFAEIEKQQLQIQEVRVKIEKKMYEWRALNNSNLNSLTNDMKKWGKEST